VIAADGDKVKALPVFPKRGDWDYKEYKQVGDKYEFVECSPEKRIKIDSKTSTLLCFSNRALLIEYNEKAN